MTNLENLKWLVEAFASSLSYHAIRPSLWGHHAVRNPKLSQVERALGEALRPRGGREGRTTHQSPFWVSEPQTVWGDLICSTSNGYSSPSNVTLETVHKISGRSGRHIIIILFTKPRTIPLSSGPLLLCRNQHTFFHLRLTKTCAQWLPVTPELN